MGGTRRDDAHVRRARRVRDRWRRHVVTGQRGRRAVRPDGGAAGTALRTRLRRHRVALSAAVAVVVAAGAVATGVAVAADDGSDGAAGVPTATPSAASSSAPGPSSAPSGDRDIAGFQDPAAPAARSDATPTRVSIPAIGVDAGLEDLHRGAAGELDPPEAWDDAGWFSDGIVPGEVGPAVIAGHVDSPTSAAVFFRLDELVAGDRIAVAMTDGSTRTFAVDRTERAAKSAFPTSDVYGTTPTPTLRLITCDGTFDTATGHYTDNLIVFADLVDD
ncbi:class F sortase [Curtobacterium sp. MCJR17_055]|nr:class F sortase [Curtobacterium sp. MCBD17_029]PYY57685.1 class F sortase [Curtobacterium sp. MCPF17_015]PYY58344.1 class F sortase [Curtobacterium sp. MCJR17_055]